jgi:hypothetical protein
MQAARRLALVWVQRALVVAVLAPAVAVLAKQD